MKSFALVVTLLTTGTAAAQEVQSTLDTTATPATPQPAEEEKPKQPGRGDFDAGGQARFPSGPDEAGEYAAFNWVAVDLEGRYFLLDTVTLNASAPLAVKKPDMALGQDPSIFGGLSLTLDARMQAPKMPMLKNEMVIGLQLTAAYMKEGAMLLSKKDFPFFVGDMKPGFAGGLVSIVKLSSLLDFSFVPSFVYQSGTMESLTALQIPMALQVAVGSLAKLNAELGIYTGDDFSFSGDNGGRIATGASLDLKLGPILLHTGAGVASLLTGGFYPTISESFYVDLNVKYAK